MKLSIKLLVLVAFVAFGFIAFNMKTDSVNAESFVSKAESRALYSRYCSSCHGADGKSNTTKGKKMEAPVISGTGSGRTIKVVTNGKGDMPGFKKKLTAAQIASIAGYVSGM